MEEEKKLDPVVKVAGRPKKIYQTPTGMHDILPEDWPYFQKILKAAEEVVSFYGFSRIETPLVENSELFEKGCGVSSDIVERQMYTFKTKGGDYFTLRPEGTAPVARAYIQHGMFNWSQPVKLWYAGPFFRYESPQAGRYRQFWQFGLEVLGEINSVVDAQVIQIFYNIFKELKFKNLVVEVNSIGCPSCRAYYKKLLVNYLRSRETTLCGDCRRRLRENPLRVLDCKEEKCQPVKAQAPQMIDHLCEECNSHFKEVLEFLDELELPYRLNPYLVRGLDYYTKTVFEIFCEPSKKEEGSEESLVAARSALAGGGRYDNLVKMIGGHDTPGCGAAMGIERVVELLKQSQLKLRQSNKQPEVFIAQLGSMAKRKSLKLFEDFVKVNVPAAESFGRDSLKSQLRIADKLQVKYTLILGQQEALSNSIIVREMKTGKQETVKLEKVVKEVSHKLKR